MAKQITANTSLIFGSKAVSQNGSTTSTNDDFVEQTAIATTTGAALQVSDVGVEGMLQIKNIGDTYNLFISLDSDATYPISIKPGITNLISVGTLGAIYHKTVAATTKFEYFLIEQ